MLLSTWYWLQFHVCPLHSGTVTYFHFLLKTIICYFHFIDTLKASLYIVIWKIISWIQNPINTLSNDYNILHISFQNIRYEYLSWFFIGQNSPTEFLFYYLKNISIFEEKKSEMNVWVDFPNVSSNANKLREKRNFNLSTYYNRFVNICFESFLNGSILRVS